METMENKTVVERLYQHAEERPDKIAVIANGTEASYGRLVDLSSRYAAFLRKNGIRKGDAVVLEASQTLDYAVAYFAIHAAGGVTVPAQRNTPEAGISAIVEAVGAKAVISVNAKPRLDGVILIDGASILEDAENTGSVPLQFPGMNDSADIIFTTGTSGASKGVELSHRALAASAEKTIYGNRYRDDTFLIVPGPLNHAGPIRKLLATVANGSTVHFLNGMVDLQAFYDALDDADGSLAASLPAAMIRTLFALSGDVIGKYADRIDFIDSSGDALLEPDKLRLCRLLPKTRLYNLYGLSEAGTLCTYDYNANPGKVNCVGKALPNSSVSIVDDDRNPVTGSAIGCIACSGDTVMKGYVNDPDATRRVLADGVVYSSDVGFIDPEGFLYVIGRKDDVINVGGLKVAPLEVETAALSIDGIEDCVCVPVRNQVSGYEPKLLVVMRHDADFSERRISDELRKKLESYKVPAKYEKVDSVARTFNGKLDRKAYRVE